MRPSVTRENKHRGRARSRALPHRAASAATTQPCVPRSVLAARGSGSPTCTQWSEAGGGGHDGLSTRRCCSWRRGEASGARGPACAAGNQTGSALAPRTVAPRRGVRWPSNLASRGAPINSQRRHRTFPPARPHAKPKQNPKPELPFREGLGPPRS